MPPKGKAGGVMNYCEDDKEKRAWIMICQVVISPDHCDQEDIKYCEAEISWGDKILTKGTRLCNLKRHLQRFHPAEAKEIEKEAGLRIRRNILERRQKRNF